MKNITILDKDKNLTEIHPRKLEELARARIDEMNFTDKELEFIFADWPFWDEHMNWLLLATREEIADWIVSGADYPPEP